MALVHAPDNWLAQTDPDLIKLVLSVAEDANVWLVQAGRTIAQEQADIDKGVSHLKDPKDSYHVIVPGVRDLALAVDLAPAILLPHGVWVVPWNNKPAFVDLAAFVKPRAASLGITPFSWGGDWPRPFDFDHYQKALPPA